MKKYDNNLVVIGAGSAGLVTALIAATIRARVTLVEKKQDGRRLFEHRLRPEQGVDSLG
ncbi:MAG: NAD(P)/FAD-dependent oxidoreductase [Gammaproteobacteria bacterium]|nr:NAD(P)/FAD-dependent oxidoreductase [Gammaproteobacteria bacterium]